MITKTLTERYEEFVDELKHRRRYFLSDTSRAFLAELKRLADAKIFTLGQGEILYRARKNEIAKGDYGHQPSFEPWPSEQMKPAKNMYAEGRANAYNITVMYLASSKATAVAEVRPDVNFPVTVAEFAVARDLKLVDLVSLRPSWSWWFRLTDDDHNLWLDLSGDYTRPLFMEEQRLNYLPTQVIAEFFMDQGYDGMVYQSQFKAREQASESGEEIAKNFVIFDLDAVKYVTSEVWKVSEQSVLVNRS